MQYTCHWRTQRTTFQVVTAVCERGERRGGASMLKRQVEIGVEYFGLDQEVKGTSYLR